MRGRTVLRAVCAAAACLLLACCVKPASYEEFIRADEATGGLYSFTLDMADSLCTYDISFYTADDELQAEGLPVYVVWTGPGSESFEELVYMKPDETIQPYRTGLVMSVPGEWKLDLRPMEVPEGFRGIGVICKRKEL